MNIVCHYSNMPGFVPEEHETRGIGGTENFACYVAKHLVKAGHQVSFYNHAKIEPRDLDGIQWANLDYFYPSEPVDVLVSFRMREVFQQENAARLKVLILADTESHGLGDDVREGRIDVVMPVGKWQMEKIAAEEDLVGHPCWMLASNGIDAEEFPNSTWSEKQIGKCIHLSTPERGLSLLLDMWPAIQNSPALEDRQPTLHLFSSFMGWGMTPEENENHCEEVYTKIDEMTANGARIVNHKHVPLSEMRQHQREADVLLYPTNFSETYCISLTECMAAGVIPIVSNRAALSERIRHRMNGMLVGEPEHDATTEEAKNEYISAAVTTLWLPERTKNVMRETARSDALKHSYAKLIPAWVQEWESRMS